MFGIRQDLCSKQSYDMIRYDLPRFVLEVGVVDAEVAVEPLHLVGDEFAWDKSLELPGVSCLSTPKRFKRDKTLAATSCSTRVRCSSLPLKTGVV
jgi:hypothetical protein